MGVRAMDLEPNAQRMAADVMATGVVLASWAALLPAIAAGFAVLWYVIQIYSWAEKRWQEKSRRLTKKRRR